MSGRTIAWIVLIVVLLFIAHHQIGHAIATFGNLIDTGKTGLK